jgi:L-alanine-DL-glutamate epimerase-like enolase superfamily enzyme
MQTLVRPAAFDIVLLSMPLVGDTTSAGKHTRLLLVRVRDASGNQGWGECPVSSRNGDLDIALTRDALRHDILPAFASGAFDDLQSVADSSQALLRDLPVSSYRAHCGAELAMLDLMGRRQMKSSGELIGPLRRQAVRYAGRIVHGADESVKEQAIKIRRQGARQLTLEIGADPDAGHRHLEIVRQILGDVELRISVNGAWSADTAIRELKAMAHWRLAGVEQPVAAGDLEGMAAVTAAGLVPVIARESVASTENVLRLIAERACDVISLSISRCGGLVNAARLHRIARDAGLGCQLEAEGIDAGLLSAAGRHLATRAEGMNYCECAVPGSRLAESLTRPSMIVSPDVPSVALRQSGLGPRVLAELVDRFATQRVSFA